MGISSSFSILVSSILFFSLLFSVSLGTSSSIHGDFFQCFSFISQFNSVPIYPPNTSNYSTVLESNLYNLRYSTPSTPKPLLIIRPTQESHIQAAVVCARKHGIEIRVRSGGHDYEGLSYVADVPFVLIDMFNLRSVNVDIEDRSAWVQSGATLGELYYGIAKASPTLGFPAGHCPTVGIGGQFTGGGYGTMFRKYGLAIDNIFDARLVDANGRILDRESMGEDLFWAIRGGGGGSFGIVISWKIRLVPVPAIVTVFRIKKRSKQGASALVHKWQQVAHQLPDELFVRISVGVVDDANEEGLRTIEASFDSMFLGGSEELLVVMKERFPELGLESKDCFEMSWIQSAVFFDRFAPPNGPLEILLDRTQIKGYFKGKSDYVREPISQVGLEGLWRRSLEESPVLIFTPFGGRMNEISESETPFPHRNGTLYMIEYAVAWDGSVGSEEIAQKHIKWIRKLYRYMTPYVSKDPRTAYVNYRDLDLGQSINGTSTYSQARVWGRKYFKNNYERLVQVKSKFDPENFFRNEQSIPSIAHLGKKIEEAIDTDDHELDEFM